ncbi:unnamed protein product [Soboliphyme baturini]|uniref:Lig_chan-Glu_bd domain-containing protein n=1 Tax=Soboliphyme baturini TaxID=241478 RepID=A0A183IEM3_9BILA|nr:unnamed protein product [Soboliphyme baturini]
MVQKAVSAHFQVSHSLTMSPLLNGYKLGVTYVGNRQFSQEEVQMFFFSFFLSHSLFTHGLLFKVYPVLLGDTDIYGNMSASVQHHITDRIRGKFVAQIQQNKFVGAQLTGDYRGVSTTCSVTVANLDLVNNAGLVVASVLRRVTPFLDLGVEAVCQYGRNVPGGKFSTLSYAARYLGIILEYYFPVCLRPFFFDFTEALSKVK